MKLTSNQKEAIVTAEEQIWLTTNEELAKRFWWMPRSLRFKIADSVRKTACEQINNVAQSLTR